jgi:hypothetical protein
VIGGIAMQSDPDAGHRHHHTHRRSRRQPNEPLPRRTIRDGVADEHIKGVGTVASRHSLFWLMATMTARSGQRKRPNDEPKG